MDNIHKKEFIQIKREKRKKRTAKRNINGEEVIFIFEKYQKDGKL